MLQNARHERFAQELAAGRNASEAYRTIFGKDNRRYASALGQRVDISGRVQDILSERADAEAEATRRAVEELAIDKKWVLERLVENANRSMQAVEIKTSQGVGTGEYKYDGAVANRSLELIGKELGMFVDRSETKVTGVIRSEPLSPEDRDREWMEQHGVPLQ